MSIRTRLALWYGGLLSVVLAATLTATYVLHMQAHLAEVDTELVQMWPAVAAAARAPDVGDGVLARALPILPGHEMGAALVNGSSGRIVGMAGAHSQALADHVRSLPDGPHTVAVDGARSRIFVEALEPGSPTRLAVAMSLGELDSMLASLRALLSVMAVAGAVVALIGGWAIAGRALRPIAILTDTARSIAGSRVFSRRVPDLRRSDELGGLASTFNDMLASLEAAHRLQQRFVSDTSHELRTPLTTIHGNAQLLAQDDTDPAERREAAEQILRETTRLTRLVDELLALARADAGAEPLDAKPIQLDEVLMESFEELRHQANGRLHVVALEAAPVLGDRDGLKQVVLILLDNALRYTPPDGRIDVSVVVHDDRVLLRVDDDGIGLDAEVRSHLFERFYRSPAARRIAPDGSGLGLPIARWIVERHGGAIRLSPREPRGATALVRLPLISPRAAPRSP